VNAGTRTERNKNKRKRTKVGEGIHRSTHNNQKRPENRRVDEGELTGDNEVSAIQVYCDDQNDHLGDNAAGAARVGAGILGVDGSGGSGLSLRGVGGDGEESNEEIH